jgi:phage baseplate assembly protein V
MNAVMQELGRRVSMLVTRARCALVDDEKKLQQVQVELFADETKDHVERFQQYGFTSHPLEGAEVIAVFLGGGRDHAIILSIDDRRHRLTKLEPGDVAIYNDTGAKIVIGRDRTITIDCDKRHEESADEVTIKTKSFKVECETLELTASDSIKVTSPAVDVNQ